MPDFDYDAYVANQTGHNTSFEGKSRKWSEGQRRFIEAWMLEYPRNVFIHDVGCGDGTGIACLREHGFRLSGGTDLNPAKLPKGDISCYGGDMHALPVTAECMNIVYCSHTLEHAHDPVKALSEFHRVLVPDGHLLLVLPFPDKGKAIVHCGKFALGTDKGDMKKLKRVLSEAGFKVIQEKFDDFREPEVWLRCRRV